MNVPCGVKAQLATVEESLVVKVVGQIAPDDIRVLDERLRNWLKL